MLNVSERKGLYKNLRHAHGVKDKALIILALLKLVVLALAMILPLFYKIFVDQVLLGGRLSMLGLVVAAYLGVYALESLAKVACLRVEQGYFGLIKLRLKRKAMARLTGGPSKSAHGVGDLKVALEDDFNGIERFYKVHLIDFVFSLTSVVALAALMFWMNIWLALMGIVAVPLSFWFAKFMSKKAADVAKQFRDLQGTYEGFVVQSFTHWKEIKSNLLENTYVDRLSAFWDQLSPLFVQRQKYWFINRGFIAFKDFFVTRMNLYFIGGVLIIQGHMTIGLLLTFMQYYADFYGHVESVTDAIATLGADRVSLDRVIDLVVGPQAPKDQGLEKGKGLKIKDTWGLPISLNQVSFAYKDATSDMEPTWVLKDFSYNFEAGTHTAITGPSGGGKSTLAKLMLGILELDPHCGTIQIDRVDLASLSQRTRGRAIGAVMQDPYLLNLSIADNLRMAKPKCSLADMQEACEKAAIHAMISALPQGYNTLIGERGLKLSGGQRQRLAIARVLLQDPAIIIFDESTSALDTENESFIMETLQSLCQGTRSKTLISIAHRQSTLEVADRVLVIG